MDFRDRAQSVVRVWSPRRGRRLVARPVWVVRAVVLDVVEQVRADGATSGVCRPRDPARQPALPGVCRLVVLLAQQIEAAVAVVHDEWDDKTTVLRRGRVYTVCAPWAGARGDALIRVFQPDFSQWPGQHC